MKISIIMTVLAVAGLGSIAPAQEAINCLTWTYQAEAQFVTKKVADDIAVDILKSGKPFGFKLIGQRPESDPELGAIFLYDMQYNRESVMAKPGRIERYSKLMTNVQWHLNSRLGHKFFCSNWAPTPWPGMSGSN
jgi:hypothetical protein